MTVSVRDARGSAADRKWVELVYRDYLDDLAPLNTGVFPALGEIGHREPDQFTRWFADPNAHLLIIAKVHEPLGFAMVTPGAPGVARTKAQFRMAEFFVARQHRRRGIGSSAVRLIFDRFAGSWEIIEYLRNPNAVSFWRKVVAHYTAGNYVERVVNGEVRQTFRSGSAAKLPENSGPRRPR
jgi:predicted acetyltransferase